MQACSEYQVRVAAVENSGAPSSSLSEKGILMVDNIDRSGKVALIYALATDGLGHFGIKEGAQAFLPEAPENRSSEDEDSGYYSCL